MFFTRESSPARNESDQPRFETFSCVPIEERVESVFFFIFQSEYTRSLKDIIEK